MKNTFELNKLIEYPKSGILSKVLIKAENNEVTLFCMAHGSEMSEHTSTKAGYVNVLEGEGVFNLKGKKIKMTKGTLIYMEKNSVHSLKAKTNTSFLLTLIK
ncbi:MAG: cupin domain-containing protein [archaeon]|jgi:nitric oxide dioxygenase